MFRKATSPATTKGSEEGNPKGEDSKEEPKTPPRTGTASPAKKLDVVSECSKKYEAYAKKLKDLLAALKKRQECMVGQRKSEQELVRQMTELSKDTPLSTTKHSYSSVNDQVNKSMLQTEEDFATKIVDYTSEWHKMVTLTFDTEIKEAKQAHKDLEHYRKKIGSLRTEKMKMIAKGKDIAPKDAEKLDRNEEKLKAAERTAKKHDANLLSLVEDLIERSWKDTYPLLVELLEFDMTASESKASKLLNLKKVLDDLSPISKKHDLRIAGRNAAELWRSRKSRLPKVEASSRDVKASELSDED